MDFQRQTAVVVILGCATTADNRPTPVLLARLETAAAVGRVLETGSAAVPPVSPDPADMPQNGNTAERPTDNASDRSRFVVTLSRPDASANTFLSPTAASATATTLTPPASQQHAASLVDKDSDSEQARERHEQVVGLVPEMLAAVSAAVAPFGVALLPSERAIADHYNTIYATSPRPHKSNDNDVGNQDADDDSDDHREVGRFNVVYVVSGGAGRHGQCEATCMHEWLVEVAGVDPSRVIKEDAAVCTITNSSHCVEMLTSHDATVPAFHPHPQPPRNVGAVEGERRNNDTALASVCTNVVLATSRFHIPRAGALLATAMAKHDTTVRDSTTEESDQPPVVCFTDDESRSFWLSLPEKSAVFQSVESTDDRDGLLRPRWPFAAAAAPDLMRPGPARDERQRWELRRIVEDSERQHSMLRLS